MIKSELRGSEILQSPFIKVKAKVTMPGKTNGKPNIKEIDKFVVAPSAKKIATYIRNQIFGTDLLTQTDGLNINWLMPTLSKALEESVYSGEAFIYIHKFDNKVYLECLRKCHIHELVQKYDKIYSCQIIEDFETENNEYCLIRDIKINEGTSIVKYSALEKGKKDKDMVEMPLEKFNKIMGTDYKRVYNLPYEVLVNVDIGQDFFKDSEKLLNEEMVIFNTIADEIEKTKTRIVTTQHYQSGDIVSKWVPTSNMYDIKTIKVNDMQDFFTLLPGDREHQMFEFLQGDLRIQSYVDAFKFCDYQIIQMANLSVATFGYEKDTYQNQLSVDMNMNTTEMTIEAIKRQIEPQINNLIENIVKLQRASNIKENVIPDNMIWDYGDNEALDDMKKLEVLKLVQRTASVPYAIRSKIITPILNKLVDEPIDNEEITKLYENENDKIEIEYDAEI